MVSEKYSGVYCISYKKECLYIGSSNDLRRRLLEHNRQLKQGKHPLKLLQKLYNKVDGKITWQVIKLCDENDRTYYEQYFLNKYLPKYNTDIACWSNVSDEYKLHIFKDIYFLAFKKRFR